MNQKKSPPLISIALCTYNGAQYLPQQLASVLAQTWEHLEIVAVDDGSTDETLAILESAAARDPRVRVFRNEANLGFRRNFEKAFSLCRGELIAPCDQDDVWHPKKLARLAEILGDHQLAYCDSELIDENGHSLNERVSQCIRMYEGNDPAAFAMSNCVSGHALLCRKEVLDRALPMPPLKFHDWWLAFVACSTGSIVYLNEPLVQYRQHTNSQTDIRGAGRKGRVTNKIEGYVELCNWLEFLSGFHSPHQPWFQKLHQLMRARARQWICPQLVSHMAQRGTAIAFPLRHQSYRRLAWRYFWGLKTKVVVNPKRYPHDSYGALDDHK
jgi:glycosyltransferase involved in cell wall biosynthesis